MNQNTSYQHFKQQHISLLDKLKQCYLFDRFPLKKKLDKALWSLKKQSKNLSDSADHGHSMSKIKASHSINELFMACEKKINQSMAKVEQRRLKLPKPDFPDALPVSKKLKEIQSLLSKHQVIVVAGETGSGKTTQLPKIALSIGRGVTGQIAHTQPRRLAARSVANRIAEELKTPLGDKVGFKVRFSDQSREETYVKLMTDGILLAETQTDRFLNRYDTIIIDEAHERSLNIDFLLGYIKQLLPRRPDLKVIITSATIDTERFSQFFNNAPVIEVSGRTFPVEIRYHSLEENGDMIEGIVTAVDELALESEGDILVFLSGEREIRESAEALRKHHPDHTEILPLYARLSPGEQSRIFAGHRGRRIVLATNVAETSLTVPGIRYVIDTGFARISRYSVRHKIQRLPIEKISRASARQRSGRCGRVSDGIAVRLYSEQDHDQRPGFTEPELLRTNLAQVILLMLSLRLGDIKAFPFLEKPSAKQINDGFLLLEQLGAINSARQLTSIGRSLAKFSVDPKIGRIIIAGQRLNVLSEVLIIASALSCQDPRERPSDKQQAADEKHSHYASKRSDFFTFLNLWVTYEAQRKHLSQNKLRKYCKANFISFMRMREWRELYQQLRTQAKDLGFRFNDMPALSKEKPSDDEDKLDYAAIHQSLLSGFLGNIGSKEEKNIYLGGRNMRFGIFPGSRLYKRKPRWLMAAEIVDTSAVYARTVAGIEPLWLEQQAEHLLKHHYYEPFWEEKTGQVSAWSRVTLYGLVINARKKVNYGPIDPQVSQEIFIRDALVSGEYKDKNRKTPRFIKFNMALISELEHLEHKSRRKDLLVDDLAIFEFYQQRIQHGNNNFIYTRAAFEQWREKVEKSDQEYLQLEQSDLLKKEAGHISDELYPPTIMNHELQLPLEYHFLPGHALDGVTVVFPLTIINQLDETVFDWLVPGLIREKITLLLRALPKVIRKQFVPIPNTVTAFLEQKTYREGLLIEQLLSFLKNSLSYTLANQLEHEMGKDAHANFEQRIPEHLKMNFKMIDKEGHELDSSRNLSYLKQQWADKALEELEQDSENNTTGIGGIDHSIERQKIISWDFESLPEKLTLERHGMTLILYPALKDDKTSVAIKLYDQPKSASDNHGQGIYRLIKLMLAKELKLLLKQLPDIDKNCLLFSPYGSCSDLKKDIVNGIVLNSLREAMPREVGHVSNINEIRSKEAFEYLLGLVREGLGESKVDVSQAVLNALQENQKLSKQLKGNIPFNLVTALGDLKDQQRRLVYKNFIANTPLVWLKRLPRYFKGMVARLEKAKHDHRRDGLNQTQISPLWEKYESRYQALKEEKNAPEDLFFYEPELEEYRWLIEELRISLFAQELKTAQPVSVKRLEKKWKALLE
ncbi:MAG: ATP-dependent RNA helicase HrpA [Gammaproteobacteria bacterium]|nr:ATP-dependent RNA helicase HrpA [Gammaproteobacteria bacterium]